ncbi:hypothetical protein ACTXT7_003485 [Hymenolepis weldensis]
MNEFVNVRIQFIYLSRLISVGFPTMPDVNDTRNSSLNRQEYTRTVNENAIISLIDKEHKHVTDTVTSSEPLRLFV